MIILYLPAEFSGFILIFVLSDVSACGTARPPEDPLPCLALSRGQTSTRLYLASGRGCHGPDRHHQDDAGREQAGI